MAGASLWLHWKSRPGRAGGQTVEYRAVEPCDVDEELFSPLPSMMGWNGDENAPYVLQRDVDGGESPEPIKPFYPSEETPLSIESADLGSLVDAATEHNEFFAESQRMLDRYGCTPSHPLAPLWIAICTVESGGDPTAHNTKEDARGIAQIRYVMVNEVNRLLERIPPSLPGPARPLPFIHDDAFDPEMAFTMFLIHSQHHASASYNQIVNGDRSVRPLEVLARQWNGGPDGLEKPATEVYWRKVYKAMRDAEVSP